ncbi:hypothetical protein VEx25_B0200 [Vibrio antiquarius]|uniref:Uncharacterized protein n=1 Tax=Vibrio antiquarius (strain Ex25) TaxID=150340 RepID=A0ABM9WXH9_VIBAE|nr:hypothetical protein VEx25_B0200 [Vibrio antiquarius]
MYQRCLKIFLLARLTCFDYPLAKVSSLSNRAFQAHQLSD